MCFSSIRIASPAIGSMLIDFDDLNLVMVTKLFQDRSVCDLRAPLPLRALIGSPEILQHGSVGVEELAAPRECPAWIKLGDLKFKERLLSLSQVESCTGHRDCQVDALLGGQIIHLRSKPGFNSTLGPAERALALNHEGKVPLRTGQASVCAQLTKGERVVTRVKCRDGERLTSDRDPSPASCRRDCVLMRELRLIVEQQVHHCQVTGYPFLGLRLKRLQLIPRCRIQVKRSDLVGNLRIIVFRTYRTQLMLQALRLGEFTVAPAPIAPTGAACPASAEIATSWLIIAPSTTVITAATLPTPVAVALRTACAGATLVGAFTRTSSSVRALAETTCPIGTVAAVATSATAVERASTVARRPSLVGTIIVTTRSTAREVSPTTAIVAAIAITRWPTVE